MSGGQPCDTGHLDAVEVTSVIDVDGRILHLLAAPLTPDRVRGRVDGHRRSEHSQQHHGQHLLSRAFVEVAKARTVGFHLGADESTIDLDRSVSPALVRAAETRCNEVAWDARPVTTTLLPRERAEALACLDGRGGGKGDLAQGGGPRIDRLEEALRGAAEAVRKAWSGSPTLPQ